MTGLDAVLLVALAAAVVADWSAVATSRRGVELVAKPASTAILVALAATSGAPGGVARAALVIGAVFGLAGDVALLGNGERAFIVGLGSFAAGHVAYVVAALAVGVSAPNVALAAPFLVVLLGYRFATETVPGARRHGGVPLAVAVAGYAVVISAMVASAYGTRSWVAAAGASLFAVSDWLLGRDRFAGPVANARIAVHVTYFAGQLLLIAGLAHA